MTEDWNNIKKRAEEMKKDYGVSPETLLEEVKKLTITVDEDVDNFIFTVIRPFCEMKSGYILSKNYLIEALKMYREKKDLVEDDFKICLAVKEDLEKEYDYQYKVLNYSAAAIDPSNKQGFLAGLDFAIGAIKKHCNNIYGANSTEVKPVDISDMYPSLIKRPCPKCKHKDSIYICENCAYRYDSRYEIEEEESND